MLVCTAAKGFYNSVRFRLVTACPFSCLAVPWPANCLGLLLRNAWSVCWWVGYGWVSAVSSLELVLRKQLYAIDWCGTKRLPAGARLVQRVEGFLLASVEAAFWHCSQLLLLSFCSGTTLQAPTDWQRVESSSPLRGTGGYSVPSWTWKASQAFSTQEILIFKYTWKIYISSIMASSYYSHRYFLSTKVQTFSKSVSRNLNQHTCAPD